MVGEWTQARIQQFIDDETQESLTLDYKGADALAKTDGKKSEITKDVAAMANSAGGIIIYGVKEYDEPEKKHLPEKIDPIDLSEFSKEWLEQVIMNIRPRIDGITIFPVTIDSVPNGITYVVDIPQSTTAHQSNDYRYYKRFNFMSVPMEDYEIRDIMGRRQHPKIELRFEIHVTKYTTDENVSFMGTRNTDKLGFPLPLKIIIHIVYTLKTWAFNTGNVYAQYVNAFIDVPYDLLRHREQYTKSGELKARVPNLDETFTYVEDNTVRDVIKSNPIGGPERAAARYVPILPATSQRWEDTLLNDRFEEINWGNYRIKWVVYCDNAQPNTGEISISDIPIIDRRDESGDDDD